MAFSTPGNQSPGGAFRSAPYSQVYTTFAAPRDLRAQLTQCPNSASGLFVNVTTAGNLVYKDAAGNSNTMPLPIGVFDFSFMAASSLEISTIVGAVLVIWHGTAGQ